MREKISCVIITLNEEDRLRRTLESVSWCDEILIVDSGSIDRTRDIAGEFGARFLEHKFEGYGPQKKWGVEQAQHSWILSIDADEVVTEPLKNEIEKVLCDESRAPGYWIEIQNIFMGRRIKFFGRKQQPHLRLFNKQYGSFSMDKVHERVEVKGATEHLRHPLDHFSYKDTTHYFEKFNAYTSLAAKELKSKGKGTSTLSVLFRFKFTFLKLYLFRGGFQNGYPGFVWCFFSAFYTSVKYIKLKELWDHGSSI